MQKHTNIIIRTLAYSLFFLGLFCVGSCLSVPTLPSSSPINEPALPTDPAYQPSQDTPAPDSPYRVGEEEDIPLPDTMPYIVFATGQYNQDNTMVEVKGTVSSELENISLATTIEVLQAGNQTPFKVNSDENGDFQFSLPAISKTVEVLTLRTINEQGEPTSEDEVVIIQKLHGYWNGTLDLDWKEVSASCSKQIENFDRIEKETEILVYKTREKAPQYIVNLFGISHAMKVSLENKITIIGKGRLDVGEGFLSNLDWGCFDKYETNFTGNLEPGQEVYGFNAAVQGDFSVKLTGKTCNSSCVIKGSFDFEKFIPLWALADNENDVFEDELFNSDYIDWDAPGYIKWEAPGFGLDELAYEYEKNIQLPLIEMRKSSSYEFLGMNNYQVISNGIWLGIGKSKQMPNASGPEALRFLGLDLVADQLKVVTFHNPNNDRAGFYYSYQDDYYRKKFGKLLPKQYRYALSPVVKDGFLYIIASNFDFENRTPPNPDDAPPALLIYSIEELKNQVVTPIVHELKIVNPLRMFFVNPQELWILDAVYQQEDLNQRSVGGGFEILQILSQLSNPVGISKLGIPIWDAPHQKGMGILNPILHTKYTLDEDYHKLYLSSEYFTYVIDTKKKLSLQPNQDQPENSDSLIGLPTALLSSNGGTRPIILPYNGHLYQFTSFIKNKGATFSVLKPNSMFTVESIRKAKVAGSIPMSYWQELGDGIMTHHEKDVVIHLSLGDKFNLFFFHKGNNYGEVR